MTVREFFKDAWISDMKVEITEPRLNGDFIYFTGKILNGKPEGRWNLDRPPEYFMGLKVDHWSACSELNLIHVTVE